MGTWATAVVVDTGTMITVELLCCFYSCSGQLKSLHRIKEASSSQSSGEDVSYRRLKPGHVQCPVKYQTSCIYP